LADNEDGYTPKARPLNDDPQFWNELRKDRLNEWLTYDLYYIQIVVERLAIFVDQDKTSLETLHRIAKMGKPSRFFRLSRTLHTTP
jgi:hypothetical protein